MRCTTFCHIANVLAACAMILLKEVHGFANFEQFLTVYNSFVKLCAVGTFDDVIFDHLCFDTLCHIRVLSRAFNVTKYPLGICSVHVIQKSAFIMLLLQW